MKSYRSLVVLGSAAALLAGCVDTSSPTTATSVDLRSPGARSTVQSGSPVGRADDLAHAFALALARPDVRVQVRNAMRASRVTEHKLVLQDFVGTPAGRHLVAAAAEAMGETQAALLARVHALPLLDFYAPFRQHRTNWRATADVHIGAYLDEAQPSVTLYSTDGRTMELHQGDAAPVRPVLFLAPAERKSERVRAQADLPGEVIQDAGDGEISGTYDWVGLDGRTHTVSLAALDRARRARGPLAKSGGTVATTMSLDGSYCDPMTAVIECSGDGGGDTGGGTGGSIPPSPKTYLREFETTATDAFGTEVELEFRTAYWRGGQVIGRRTLRYEGVERDIIYTADDELYGLVMQPNLSDYIRVNVYETDWLDGEDYGTRNFYWDDYLRTRSIIDNGSLIQIQTVTQVTLGTY